MTGGGLRHASGEPAHEMTKAAPVDAPLLGSARGRVPAPRVTPSPRATTTGTPWSPNGPQGVPATVYAIPGYYILRFAPVPERPTDFNWEYRHHLFRSVQWSSWGPDGAQGTGTEIVSVCDPDCTSGPWFNGPVQIRASNPQPPAANSFCPADILFYTDVVVVYPDSAPPPFVAQDLQWMVDGGRPAAHYVAHQPSCDP